MESFDFSSLDSEALDQTLAFLHAYNIEPSLDPAFGSSELFDEASMQWPPAENIPSSSLFNADLDNILPNSLDDNSPQGAGFLGPECGLQNELVRSMPPEATIGSSQSGRKMRRSCHAADATGPLAHLQTIFSNMFDLQNHKTAIHIADVLNTWPGPCSWPGCNCKAVFKTSKQLESHVYNIHVTPLCCTVAGCKHDRPFERQADLERHVASKHTKERKYKCLQPGCYQSFVRKDKFKLHHRNWHDRFACPHNHCNSGASSEVGLKRHLIIDSYWREHCHYECGLGSCAFTKRSCFTSYVLTVHVLQDHKLPREVASQALETLRASETKVLTLAHLPDVVLDFQDCEGCKKIVKEAGSENNE